MFSTDHMRLYSETRSCVCLNERTRDNVARYASATPLVMDQRLYELSREWWAERACTATVAMASLASMFLPLALGINWLAVPGFFAALLVIQATFAWSPVMPILRAIGYRTACEISNERYALKALRGDFHRLDVIATPQDVEDMSRFENEGGPPAPEPVMTASHPSAVDEAVVAAQS